MGQDSHQKLPRNAYWEHGGESGTQHGAISKAVYEDIKIYEDKKPHESPQYWILDRP